jgi:hypothetical protein
MKRTLTSLGLTFLLTTPAAAELCLEPDGFYRPCFGTAVVSSPTTSHHNLGGGGRSSNQDYMQYLEEKRQAQERQERAEDNARALENWRQDWDDYTRSRLSEYRTESERGKIQIERKYNRGLQRKTEVEQRYQLGRQGYSNEAINRAYGR